MTLHIERRPKACEERYTKELVDCFALVESRSGITLRWFESEQGAEDELARTRGKTYREYGEKR